MKQVNQSKDFFREQQVNQFVKNLLVEPQSIMGSSKDKALAFGTFRTKCTSGCTRTCISTVYSDQ
jgi:hypothetical protein